MIVKHNIKTSSISWLRNSYDNDSSTGIINNYYIPENMEELRELCVRLQKKNLAYRVIGHTSNIYFLPDTNIPNLISTKRINKWNIEGNILSCECGTNVKSLARAMVDSGMDGFAGLIDLPGTIGGAIYGNASVGNYSISQMLKSIIILNSEGIIEEMSYNDMDFQFRSSCLKRKEMKGIILSCTLQLKRGDVKEQKRIAEEVHKWRIENQPGPLNNLGTTALLNDLTCFGYVVALSTKLLDYLHKNQLRNKIILRLAGASILHPYLFGFNRFIWKDSKAHELFETYLKFINRMYRNPKLEIEVF